MTTIWILWFKQPNGYVGFELLKTYPRQSKLDDYQARGVTVYVVKQPLGSSPFGPPTYDRS